MTKIDMIKEVLIDHSCLSATEISGFIYHKFNEHISPSSISGSLRTLYTKGEIGKDKNLKGNTVYWLTNKQEKWVYVK